MTEKSPRVRFAPSPTGFVHVGSLRTALYNFLFARQNGGTYILRVEDTDQSRLVPGSKENLIHSLAALGLNADEGVIEENGMVVERGDKGPYQQSDRLTIYKKYAEDLVAGGHAYYCFCTPERLTALREEQQASKRPPKYDKHCLSFSQEETSRRKENEPHVVRLNVTPGEKISFRDEVRGEVSFNTYDVDDQVLLKSDGFPTYHLANVVDDHLMGITHVIRGEEWLPSTPKHILLYRAFGWEAPQFAHLPLLLNPDKSKLSKRQGDVAVEDYLRKGYLKPALVNFVALLGWNPGNGSTQEIFSLEDLVQHFDVRHIHKGGAVFDHKKLDWMNSEYIKKTSLEELYVAMVEGEFFDRDFIKTAPAECQSPEYLKRVLTVEQERLATLGGFGTENPFFFCSELTYDRELLRWKESTDEDTKAALLKAKELLAGLQPADFATREHLQDILLAAAGDKRGEFLWPLRVALSGAQRSPSPGDLAFVLGQTETLKRLEKAISM